MKTEAPRVLIVTPEVSYLPHEMCDMAVYLHAKAGGLGDVSAALIRSLYEQGVDVSVAIPDYRTLYNRYLPERLKRRLQTVIAEIPAERLHLAVDRAFFYRHSVYSMSSEENLKIACAFQREIIHHIVPRVKPDLIHCNDWTTGLIPAMARQIGIPCLFTIHNLHTLRCPLEQVEDRGIDTAEFWPNLYFDYMPGSHGEAFSPNRCDFLASAIFAAHFINTVSPTFLLEIAKGRHHFVEPRIRGEIASKVAAGCAVGILNAPPPSYDPAQDEALAVAYGPENHCLAKQRNKLALQRRLGLEENPRAPVFFWPSRLDPIQKGCGLLLEIFYRVLSQYWGDMMQMVFVADGPDRVHFEHVIQRFNLQSRAAIQGFDETLSRLAFAGSDFVLMPSSFEPCGLPQMIGNIYGALPVAHDTGGLHDSVQPLDIDGDTGNGFLFEVFDANGLAWAIGEAMQFYHRPDDVKEKNIARIMRESRQRFNFANTAARYIDVYERMLQRPLIPI